MRPNSEKIVRSFIVIIQRGHDQLVDILLMDWYEVSRSQHQQPSDPTAMKSTAWGQNMTTDH